MSTTTAPSPANPKAALPLKPPDERFWKKYSPHHELPVSMAGSFLLHVLGIGFIALVLVGVLTGLGKTRQPEISPIAIAGGGGGNTQGVGDGPNTHILPSGKEAPPTKLDKPLYAGQPKVETPDLKQINKNPVQPIELPAETTVAARTLPPTDAVLGELLDIGKHARAKIDGLIAGHGKGGPGSGGGTGSGAGPGDGPGIGPGKSRAIENERTRRQERWVMNFNTRDGNDYLKQLQHLGAILAVPQSDGSYKVYRDFKSRPYQGKEEDISTINRIYWIDDKPHSVQSLAQALGILPPAYIAAFFPESLEKELRRKEEAHFRGPEERIAETLFQVVWRGGRYEPIVVAKPKLRGL
jgi:hypothetical protein